MSLKSLRAEYNLAVLSTSWDGVSEVIGYQCFNAALTLTIWVTSDITIHNIKRVTVIEWIVAALHRGHRLTVDNNVLVYQFAGCTQTANCCRMVCTLYPDDKRAAYETLMHCSGPAAGAQHSQRDRRGDYQRRGSEITSVTPPGPC